MNIARTAMSLVGFVLLTGCAVAPRAPETPAGQSVACHPVTEAQIAGLFERWNDSLQTGNPHAVVANYAERSILLPTLSNKPRISAAEKDEYFEHFLENQPSGKIDFRFIELGCNAAFDAGLYTFTFRKTGDRVAARYTFTYAWDGKQWLITSHHSSLMPEHKP
jgi:uncharacterized protein (TIGR02246 family)